MLKRTSLHRVLATLLLLALAGCAKEPAQPEAKNAATEPAKKQALLLVTLDTTRADALTPEVAPNFAALAARGISFTQAYSTAPTTLTAHASMMSGLYPAGHGVHENGRQVGGETPLLAAELKRQGYRAAAFVSGYPLAGHYGLARGFDVYDDDFGKDGAGQSRVERSATETTDRALRQLQQERKESAGFFLWVHYYDPHEPYAPPEPFKSQFKDDPYRGEIAAMDHELGRLVDAFEKATAGSERKIVILADHGEGRGEHGETFHGNLLYQGVMHVPLVIVGDGIAPGVREDAVSTRQIRATFLDWALGKQDGSLMEKSGQPALGEAMQPFLNYRWQPQVMAVGAGIKLIRSGRFEIYDVLADPGEQNDLAQTMDPERTLARAIADYPLPAAGNAAKSQAPPSEEEQKKLASLGYVSSNEIPQKIPENAPRAVDMTPLFADLDRASHEFVNERYAQAVPLFERILQRDPGNLMAAVRLAVCHSLLGHEREALATFERAKKIDADSIELRHYLALHYFKQGKGELAAPLLEEVLAAQPERYAALATLAKIRRQEGDLEGALQMMASAVPLAPEPGRTEVELGQIYMDMGQTDAAVESFEDAKAKLGDEFRNHLELGVLYLAQERFNEAKTELDRVDPTHPAIALALFKRAQVSVLLGEADRAERVRLALERADPPTRQLILNERLFAGLLPP